MLLCGQASSDSSHYEQGTWAMKLSSRAQPRADERRSGSPATLDIGINPATAYLLLNRYVSLMPGDWIGQTAANAAMGQYIIALAKLAGVKTLNVVRREEAAEQVRKWEVTACPPRRQPAQGY